MKAVEVLVAEDMPIIATEVFAIEQAIRVCELYCRVSERTGCRPPFYVTHITGIFDEYLAKLVEREGIEIAPQVLSQAGCAIARKQYQILQERQCPAVMLGGGARGTHHFTEMVGGAVHVTINWSTAAELIQCNPPVVRRMDSPAAQPVIEELADKLVVSARLMGRVASPRSSSRLSARFNTSGVCSCEAGTLCCERLQSAAGPSGLAATKQIEASGTDRGKGS